MSRAQVSLSLVLLVAGSFPSSNSRPLSACEVPPTAVVVRQWVKDPDDARFEVREAATRNFLKAGTRAPNLLANVADWKSLEVIRRALEILKELSHSADTETAIAAAAVLAELGASAGPAAARARLALGDRWLSPENEAFLKSLLQGFLFDPQGAEYVQVAVSTHWSIEEEQAGWLCRHNTGDRIYFTDGDSIPAPLKTKITRVDFQHRCRKFYGHEHSVSINGEQVARSLTGNLISYQAEPSVLVDAAWLYRLGHRMLAAKVLARVPDKSAELSRLRSTLARHSYQKAVSSFEHGQDDQASAHLERLLRLYPAESAEFPQTKPLVDELARRESQRLLRKARTDNLPGNSPSRVSQKQLAFLIDSLDLVQPDGSVFWSGGLSFHEDCRVAALLALGEMAIPALIDTLANDDRLTRMVRHPDRWYLKPHVVTVREVALPVAQSILSVSHFDWHDTGRGHSSGDEDGLKKSANALRNYWREFGRLPFEERMMRVLKDPEASSGAMREAAENLARPEKTPMRGFWRYLSHDPGESPGEPRALVMKFTAPTAAEAVLSAMDRDLSHAGRREDSDPFLTREDLEDDYLFPLIALGDRRIVPELTKRAEHTADIHMRRKWCLACFHLGNPKPLQRLSREFGAGNFPELTDHELKGLVYYFASVPLAEADRALYALADPKHPLFDGAVRGVRVREHFVLFDNPFLAHPSCLSLLRTVLKDETPTKTALTLSGDAPGSGPLLEILKDPSKRREEVQERRCDRAAQILAGSVFGFPEYSALLKDADNRILAIQELVDRLNGKVRALTRAERECLPWGVRLAPVLPALGRPAAAADVKAARAIFHLDGKGKQADLELPALGIRKKTAEKDEPTCSLIVQAEVGPDGRIFYGAIERHAIRMIAANEFAKVVPLSEVERGFRPK